MEIKTAGATHSPGESLSGEFIITNNCNEDRSMKFLWTVFVVRYDGVVIKQLMKEKNNVIVKCSESMFLVLKLLVHEIYQK